MDTRSIGALLLKISGLVLVIISVANLPAYFPLISRDYPFSIGETLGAAAITLGPMAVLGAVLWFFPGTIANKIVSGAGPAEPPDPRSLELIALTVLGIYLITGALVGVVRDIVIVVVSERRNIDFSLIPASVVGHGIAAIAQMLIGAALCIGGRGISRVIERLRR